MNFGESKTPNMKTQIASISVACLVLFFSRIDARFAAASQQSRDEIDATGNMIETHEYAGEFKDS